MDSNLYHNVDMILTTVSFIAVGGALALIFFFVFAPSVLGSRTIQKQLKAIQMQMNEMTTQLKQIAQSLKEDEKNSKMKK